MARWISGVLMTLIASFCPSPYLDDLTSAGILVAFTTNPFDSAGESKAQPKLLPHCLVVANMLCFCHAPLINEMTWLSSE
jgi:hypothetical protein